MQSGPHRSVSEASGRKPKQRRCRQSDAACPTGAVAAWRLGVDVMIMNFLTDSENLCNFGVQFRFCIKFR